jgi:hypothetical protein
MHSFILKTDEGVLSVLRFVRNGISFQARFRPSLARSVEGGAVREEDYGLGAGLRFDSIRMLVMFQ